MELQKAVQHVFLQLTDSLNQMDSDQYNYSCNNLSGNTIGQHVRHIIEMFQCLEAGYQDGEINYENRKRDYRIEKDKIFATGILQEIMLQIMKENKALYLFMYFNSNQDRPEKIRSNYFREVAYNLEHTIHHMALIRVGLREIGGISIDATYGVASSTIKYREQCAR